MIPIHDILEKGLGGIIPHKDDQMVIKMQIYKWDVKRVMVGLKSSSDIFVDVSPRGQEFYI